MTKKNKKCETCLYCEKYELPNFAKNMLINNAFKDMMPDVTIFYKCHIQGPPKRVNPEYDWCYQWKMKND